MKLTRLAVYLAGCTLSLSVANAGTVYLDDSAGNLFAGDPTTGTYVTVGNSGIAFTDIGFAAGVLYGLDSSGNLYSINTISAAATSIGFTGDGTGDLVGLSDSTTGLLLAGGNGNIYNINTSTGAATAGATGGAYTTAGDLDFDGSGNLWLTSTTPAPDELYQIDPLTGAVLADAGALPVGNVFGVAYDSDNGVLYGFETGGIQFDINTANAALSGTFVTETGTVAGDTGLLGAAFIASTPEPSSFGMLLAASALALFAVRRQRKVS